jgi:hypothetical protein
VRGLVSHGDDAVHVVIGFWALQYASSCWIAVLQSEQLAHVKEVPFETSYWIEVHTPPRPVVVHSSYVRPPEPHATAGRQVVPPPLASSPASASAEASASVDASPVLESPSEDASPPDEDPASPDGTVAQ